MHADIVTVIKSYEYFQLVEQSPNKRIGLYDPGFQRQMMNVED